MYADTEWGPLRRGSLPGNLMADAILDSDEPVRALIVVAGNPLLTIGGGDRLQKAFEQLDLIVGIDLYRNATGELAHDLLPSTDMLERDDLNITGIGLSHQPFAQYTAPVVEPRGERRTEWWICHRLLQAAGAPFELDDPAADRWSKWRHMLARGSNIDLGDLEADPRPIALPMPEPGRFYEQQIQTDDQRVDCCPPTFAPARESAERIFTELASETDGLKLIQRRAAWMMNSWLRNLPRMQKGGRTTNPLYMHPDDAAGRGLVAGSPMRMHNANGSLDAVVDVDDSLLPGVVAMSHGWGQARNPGMSVAQAAPGTNCNVLLPSGPDSFERLSSQAHMTGIPVRSRPPERRRWQGGKVAMEITFLASRTVSDTVRDGPQSSIVAAARWWRCGHRPGRARSAACQAGREPDRAGSDDGARSGNGGDSPQAGGDPAMGAGSPPLASSRRSERLSGSIVVRLATAGCGPADPPILLMEIGCATPPPAMWRPIRGNKLPKSGLWDERVFDMMRRFPSGPR